jgi:hypothetical protein
VPLCLLCVLHAGAGHQTSFRFLFSVPYFYLLLYVHSPATPSLDQLSAHSWYSALQHRPLLAAMGPGLSQRGSAGPYVPSTASTNLWRLYAPGPRQQGLSTRSTPLNASHQYLAALVHRSTTEWC